MTIKEALLTLAFGIQSVVAKQPHIVFVLADDLGYNDVSYKAKKNGNNTNIINTPNIDMLAGSGVMLENYYIQPVCSPTRAALLTGRYSTHTGIHIPLIDSARGGLPTDETLVSQLLKEVGYKTYMVGKWHLGFMNWAHTPQERGFDYFFGFYAGSTDYYNLQSECWAGSVPDGCFQSTNDGEAVTGCDLHRMREPICNNTEYSTMLFTSEAERLIREHDKDVPMFLYMSHQAVHVGNKPMPSHPEYALNQAPPQYIEPYSWVENEQRRNLSAMVSVLDESCGNLTQTLKEQGMWNDTIFIFSTDNGGPLSDSASNYPLNNGKATCWEGGCRGVGFLTGGDNVFPTSARGHESHSMMHVTDWLPTLCNQAGCRKNLAKPLDGFDMWDSIFNKTASNPRTEILHCMIEVPYSPSIRVGDYKIVGTPPMLYNIREDPGEHTDLATQMPEKVKELQARLAYHNQSSVPPCDRLAIDPASNPKHFGGVWTPWSNDTGTGCPKK